VPRSLGRFLLALLPLTTFVVVGVLVLGLGAPRPIEFVRVWGGPTDRSSRFSAWVEAEAEGGRPLAGVKLRLSAQPAQGSARTVTTMLDLEGRAEVSFDFERAPGSFELRVDGEHGLRGQGQVALSSQRWLAGAGRHGGFSRLPQASALKLQIAPARGVFAVPFPGQLWVRVTRDGQAVASAKVQLKSDGAQLGFESTETGADGLARFALTPSEHVVTVRASAVAPDGARGELFSNVPVVPGAIEVERQGSSLRVRSPIERSAAFIALVTEQGRWSGARVPLSAVGDGTAVGVLELSALPGEPTWAVAKSEPSAPSSGCVGWPLFESAEPGVTLDVADTRLLDTEKVARTREHQRRLGIRRLALGVGLVGAVFSVVALAWATLRQRKQLGAHLAAELGAEPSAELLPPQSVRSLVSISLIILGFFAIAAIVAWRLV
jgi:hypothetical protein